MVSLLVLFSSFDSSIKLRLALLLWAFSYACVERQRYVRFIWHLDRHKLALHSVEGGSQDIKQIYAVALRPWSVTFYLKTAEGRRCELPIYFDSTSGYLYRRIRIAARSGSLSLGSKPAMSNQS